jgi:hypothetical protein
MVYVTGTIDRIGGFCEQDDKILYPIKAWTVSLASK